MDKITYPDYYGLAETSKTIPPESFDRFCALAENKLKALTSNKPLNEEHSNAWKTAVCLSAEVIYQDCIRPADVTSETTDGYSVSYGIKKSLLNRISNIALEILGNTGLLYQGVE